MLQTAIEVSQNCFNQLSGPSNDKQQAPKNVWEQAEKICRFVNLFNTFWMVLLGGMGLKTMILFVWPLY